MSPSSPPPGHDDHDDDDNDDDDDCDDDDDGDTDLTRGGAVLPFSWTAIAVICCVTPPTYEKTTWNFWDKGKY